MTEIYTIYLCANPECQMRIPVLPYETWSSLCPLCKSAMEPCGTYPLSPAHGLSIKPQVNAPQVSILLDNIRSTFNVGSVFRTADGAGLTHLYLCGMSPTPKHPKVAKTALGAEDKIPWTYHPNAIVQAKKLLATGHRLWAIEGTPTAISLFEIPQPSPDRPIVIIAGNEVSGVDPELLALCEHVLWIPMLGVKTSLNVANAVGIAAYTLRFS